MSPMAKKAAVLTLSLGSFTGAIAGTDSYKIDPVHTTVGFEVKHMGISTVPGSFKAFDGEFSFDESDLTKTTLKATAKVDSITTGENKRDDHLKSPDFFDAAKFPELKFESTKAEKTGSNTFNLTGNLTMHGVTKPVTFTVTYNGKVPGTKDMPQKTGFEAHAKVSRKDFEMKFNKLVDNSVVQAVSDEVLIKIAAEGNKK